MKLGLLSFVIISLVTPSLATLDSSNSQYRTLRASLSSVFVWYPNTDVTPLSNSAVLVRWS